MYDIAVIIPSCNRVKLLRRTLELLNEQTYPADRYEAIVADDGSADGTEEAVSGLQGKVRYKLKYTKQKHMGPAAARNRGIKESESRFILFIGDDIFPRNDLIARHMSLLTQYSERAILGYVDWCRDEEITDFMKYVSPNGFQFRFNTIKDPGDCDFKHFYTSNISLGRQWFAQDMFDEDFPYGALEDAEISYRLNKKGLRIMFDRNAVGYHCHGMTIDSFCERMRLTGISSVIMLKKHPELKPALLPVSVSLAGPLFFVLSRLTFLEKLHKRLYWFCRIVDSYLKGVKEGQDNPIFNT